MVWEGYKGKVETYDHNPLEQKSELDHRLSDLLKKTGFQRRWNMVA